MFKGVKKGLSVAIGGKKDKDTLTAEGRVDVSKLPAAWRSPPTSPTPPAPTLDMAQSYADALPRVLVQVVSARALSKNGPYSCKLRVGSGQVHETRKVDGTGSAEWRDEFLVRIEPGSSPYLFVLHVRAKGGHGPLGTLSLDLKNDLGLRMAGDTRNWTFKLSHGGEITLQFTCQTGMSLPNMSMKNVDGMKATVALPFKPAPEIEVCVYQALRLQGPPRLHTCVLVAHRTGGKAKTVLRTAEVPGTNPFWDERIRIPLYARSDAILISLLSSYGPSGPWTPERVCVLTIADLSPLATATESRRWYAFVGRFKGAAIGLGFTACSNMKALESLPEDGGAAPVGGEVRPQVKVDTKAPTIEELRAMAAAMQKEKEINSARAHSANNGDAAPLRVQTAPTMSANVARDHPPRPGTLEELTMDDEMSNWALGTALPSDNEDPSVDRELSDILGVAVERAPRASGAEWSILAELEEASVGGFTEYVDEGFTEEYEVGVGYRVSGDYGMEHSMDASTGMGDYYPEEDLEEGVGDKDEAYDGDGYDGYSSASTVDHISAYSTSPVGSSYRGTFDTDTVDDTGFETYEPRVSSHVKSLLSEIDELEEKTHTAPVFEQEKATIAERLEELAKLREAEAALSEQLKRLEEAAMTGKIDTQAVRSLQGEWKALSARRQELLKELPKHPTPEALATLSPRQRAAIPPSSAPPLSTASPRLSASPRTSATPFSVSSPSGLSDRRSGSAASPRGSREAPIRSSAQLSQLSDQISPHTQANQPQRNSGGVPSGRNSPSLAAAPVASTSPRGSSGLAPVRVEGTVALYACTLCKTEKPKSQLALLKGRPFCGQCKARVLSQAQQRGMKM